jgi:acylphosphatase
MIKSAQIRITGRVQGVGFRYYTVMKAKEYGISGFVMNAGDGAVFIEAEGDEEDLDSFILWCEKGPVSARVDNVDITPGVVKSYKGFGIKH